MKLYRGENANVWAAKFTNAGWPKESAKLMAMWIVHDAAIPTWIELTIGSVIATESNKEKQQ